MAAKRLTDTGKWEQAWFRKLSPKLKAINDYLCDRCDHAGIWEIDMDTLAHYVNDRDFSGGLIQVTMAEIIEAFNGKVRSIRQDKLFLEGFVLFQYKLRSLEELNFKNKVHLSVIENLEKAGIIRVDWVLANPTDVEVSPYIIIVMPLASPLDGACLDAKDKEQDKDKVKNLVKELEARRGVQKTTAEPVGSPAAETKDCLGPIAEFSESEILRPVLVTISKNFQNQLVAKYKDVPWIKGELEDCVNYHTGTGQGNPKTWGKLIALWFKRSRNKPNAFKVASGQERDPFDFNPYSEEGGQP